MVERLLDAAAPDASLLARSGGAGAAHQAPPEWLLEALLALRPLLSALPPGAGGAAHRALLVERLLGVLAASAAAAAPPS